MKKTLRLSAEHIMYGIAIANALRLAWAYAEADADGNVISLPGAFGLLLGASVSIGTAFIAGKLGGRLTKGRKVLTWAVFVLVLMIEPFLLAPITRSDMSASMSALLGPLFSWAWAVSLALVPSLVLAGVAVANGGLVDGSAQPSQSEGSQPVSDATTGSAGSKGRSAKGKRAKAQLSQIPCPHAGAGCDVTKPTQNAINAHAGRCKYKPTTVYVEQDQKVKS